MKSITYTFLAALLILSAFADPAIEWGNKGKDAEACDTPEVRRQVHGVFQEAFGAQIQDGDDRRLSDNKRELFRSIWCDICDFTAAKLSLTCLVYFKPCNKRDRELQEEFSKEELKEIKTKTKEVEKTLKGLDAGQCDASKFYVSFKNN